LKNYQNLAKKMYGMKYQDIVIVKLPRQNFILLVVNLALEKAPQ